MSTNDNIIIISSEQGQGKTLYGLALESGTTLVPPLYEDVKIPIKDVFMFEQDDKWGLMSLDGDVLLSPQYDNIFAWNEDFVVVGKGAHSHFMCGVVDWNGREVIPTEYGAIALTGYPAFRCYDNAEYDWGRNHNMDHLNFDGNPYIWKNSKNETLSTPIQIWRRDQQIDTFDNWLILDNLILLNPNLELQRWVAEKELKFIQITPNGTLISKDKRGKYGLRDLTGKSIVLQIYDDMKLMSSGIIVLYNGKIGIIGTNGNNILPSEYLEIRGNIIDESNKDEIGSHWVWNWNKKNGVAFRYSKNHPLDTTNLEQIIVRDDFFVSEGTIACCKKGESNLNTFVTRNNNGENIFSIENGFVLEENVDKVIPITSEEYLIQRADKFRLISTGSDSNSLSMEFDEAKYYGEGLLYYKVDGVWGVKLFSPKLYCKSFFRVEKNIDILPSYHSVRTIYGMMGMFIYFEVQNSYKSYFGEEGICAQLLNTRGECILGGQHQYNGHFSIHDSIILCQIGDKFGFADFNDDVIIPFKFDEIQFRGKGKHGGFNVRIGDYWGILKHNGRESRIKYSEQVPFKDKYEIVSDALSELKGVLDTETCEEVVPCLYSHIILEEDRVIVARGGCPRENCIVDYLYAKWGCYDTSGKLIVPVKYDYIKIDGEYVLAGYEGGFMTYGQNHYYKKFGGKYALYNSVGELLIEGFSQYSLGDNIWAFYFGGKWKTWTEEYGFDEYSFEYGVGRWLLVTPELKTLLPQTNGESLQIKHGTKIYWTKEVNDKDKKVINRINFPLNLLVEHEYHIENGWVIDKGGGEAINIATGERITSYLKIDVISNNLLFVMDNKYNVGIIDKNNQIVVSPKFHALTYPVGNFFIGVLANDHGEFVISLFDLTSKDIVNEGIQLRIEESRSAMEHSFRNHFLLMYHINENDNTLHGYAFENSVNWIKTEVAREFNPMRVSRIGKFNHRRYWFSINDMEPEKSYSCDDSDYNDYLRDSWDAMTDGMYGDMPDGFDGDYDFLGR